MHAVPNEPDDALPPPALTPDAAAAARRDLATLAAAYWDHGLEESPIGCTYLGLPRGQDRLDERGPAARARRERALDGLLRRVERAAARLRTAQTANTDAVRAALDDGIPAQVVADAAGLGVNTVRRIKYQAGVDD